MGGGGGNPMSIYSSTFGQMGIGLKQLKLENYDVNKHHHRVRRPLISKSSYISAK